MQLVNACVSGSAKASSFFDNDNDSTVKYSNCSKDVAIPTCVNANYISDNEDDAWGKPNEAPVPGNGLR